MNRVGTALVAATGVMVVVLLVFMLGIEPNRRVAVITLLDGTNKKITTAVFQKRVLTERTRAINRQKTEAAKANLDRSGGFEPDYRPLATLGFAAGVIDRLTREILIQEEGSRRGLSVGDDEVDLAIERAYGLVVWPEGTTKPANSSAAAWLEARPELREQVEKTRAEAGVRLERDGLPKDYRRIVQLELLEEKLREAFFAGVPIEQDRVILKLIRLETDGDARAAVALLEQGGLFDELYARATHGLLSGATGTQRDWSSRAELERDYNGPFGDSVMALHPGEAGHELIAAAHGWYLVKLERREIRTMPADWRWQRGLDAMQTWLAQQNSRVVQYPEWMNRVPATPHIPNREYADGLPPPDGGAGPTGKARIPGAQPGTGQGPAGGKTPWAGPNSPARLSTGPLIGHAHPGTSPASRFEQFKKGSSSGGQSGEASPSSGR